jgi:hypothetical protein
MGSKIARRASTAIVAAVLLAAAAPASAQRYEGGSNGLDCTKVITMQRDADRAANAYQSTYNDTGNQFYQAMAGFYRTLGAQLSYRRSHGQC